MRIKRRNGFTLLEVVAALAVIALVAVAALAMVGQQLNVASRARQIARAQGLATQRMAMLRLLTSSEVQSLPDTIANGRFPYPDNAFTWHVVSAAVANDDYLSDVQIEVRWSDGAYTLRTRLYAPPGADPVT